jgi:hypothetical protein
MKNIYLTFLVCTLFLGGCATQHVADFALEQPEEGVTAIHPDMMEQGSHIVSFTSRLPLEFLVEVKHGVKGVWPIVATHMTDEDAPIEDGFCYTVEERSFAKNPWCAVLMKCVISGTREHFSDYKFALVNKDGGVWITSPAGEKMINENQWNIEDFEDDFDHRIEVMNKVGQTLDDINEFWRARASELGISLSADVSELIISSHSVRWQNFRKEFIAEMGYELTLPNGEVVVSQISRDEMVNELSHNPRISRWQKFTSRLAIPLGSPEIMAFGVGSSILNGGIAAMIDSDWEARVARGTGQYRTMAGQIVYIAEQVSQCKQQSDIERYIISKRR